MYSEKGRSLFISAYIIELSSSASLSSTQLEVTDEATCARISEAERRADWRAQHRFEIAQRNEEKLQVRMKDPSRGQV